MYKGQIKYSAIDKMATSDKMVAKQRKKSFIMRNIIVNSDHERASVQSISRAASILICMNTGINTLTSIANYCKLSKATVHRLLRALEEVHFVVHDPVTRRYYLGHLFNQFAFSPQIMHEYLIVHSIEAMRHISDVSEEMVILSILIGIRDIQLYDIESKQDTIIAQANVRKSPHLAGAMNKVLFSQLTDHELAFIMEHIKIVSFTEHTITDKEILRKHIKQARQQGYAVSTGETVVGGMGISVPIANYTFPAALSIVGPEYRMKPRAGYLIGEMKSSAELISNYLAELKP